VGSVKRRNLAYNEAYRIRKLGARKPYIKPASDFISQQRKLMDDIVMNCYDQLGRWFGVYRDDLIEQLLIEDKHQKVWEEYFVLGDRDVALESL
jgi:hypothetical protein